MTTTREAIKQVLDERANLWETEGKPLADIAATRELTADEREKADRAEEAFRAFDQRMKLLNLTLEQERAIAEFGDALKDNEQVRSAFETELRSVLSERSKQAGELRFSGKDVTRALGKGTAAAGGNTVPQTFWDQLIVPLRNFVTVINAGATVFTTASGEDITLPRVATFGSAGQIAEAGDIAAQSTDPTFDQATIKAFKLGQFLGISRELAEDSAIDIEQFVSDLIGANIGLIMGSRLMVGTGTNQTEGLATAAPVGVTGGTGVLGAPTVDNLIDLQYAVAAPYRVNSAWMIADSALAGLRKLKDTTGQYLWVPSVQMGQPDLLLGKPVYGDPNLTSGLNAKSVLYGDASKYWVRIVNSLRIERSEHALFGTDQIAFRGLLRTDGKLVDVNAVKAYKGAAS